jgi:integrase
MADKKADRKWQRTKTQFLLRNSESGIYYARLYRDNKQIWKSLQTDVYSVAVARLAEERKVVQAAVKADRVTSTSATIGALTEAYMASVRLDRSIKKSMVRYRQQCVDAIRNFGEDILDLPLKSVTESHCEAFASKCADHYSAQRHNNIIDTLRLILDLGIKKGLIFRNPAADIEKLKVARKFLQLPTTDQFIQIVEIARKSGAWCQTQTGDFIEFLAYSGCRLDEAKHVRWTDVNEDAIWIHGGDEGTKNSERRQIPIIGPMRRLLDDLRANPRYFRGDRGEYVVPIQKCNEALATACARLGIKKITHHDLRHLFATRCIESGVDIPTVSRWLGHKDGGALAMRTYGHLRQEHSQSMAKLVSF